MSGLIISDYKRFFKDKLFIVVCILAFVFAVMTQNTIECLQTYIVHKYFIKHPYTMYIVKKMLSELFCADYIKKLLARMSKWCVANIMSQCDGFYKVGIKR